MKFTKMQGLGNDYVYIDCTKQKLSDPAALAVRSRTGISASVRTVCLYCRSDCADFRMVMYNSDGLG